MSSVVHDRRADAFNEIASSIRSNSGWFLSLGVLQIIVGILAFSFSFSATIASVALLGSILLIAAGAQTILARSWRGFFLSLSIGILYGVAGVLTLAHPIAAAEGLTLMLAAAFLAGGMFRIVVSLVERFPSWGWVLLNGVITVLLGVMIAAQWPVSGLWVIGVFVGIDIIAKGVTWSALAMGVRTTLAPFEDR